MATNQANPRNLSLGGESPASPGGQFTSAIRVGRENGGLLRVVGNGEMVEREREEAEQAARMEEAAQEAQRQNLAGHVLSKFNDYRSTRETRGISVRLVESLRTFRGQYSPAKLQEIQQFGGSDVYSRMSALKCRGATAMLRDIYMSGKRPWFIAPTPKPNLPEDVTTAMLDLVNLEVQGAEGGGQQIDQQQVSQRVKQLTAAAEKATLEQAKKEAEKASRYLDDMLVEGGFYDALVQFLVNLPIFPYAFMKGPVVQMATDVQWENGQAVTKNVPKMYWCAPSPFDIYWNSGVRNFEDADVIEHLRLTRAELNNLLGIPGYNDEAIRKCLDQYGKGGLTDWLDYTDQERARLEQREDPHINYADMIDTLEFHGWIQGRMLREYGLSEDEVDDVDTDYFCNVWVIGQHVIKAQIDPNPRKRHPYYMTSFEKVPGAIVGHGVVELINDIQSVANATLRAMVNNLSIASGPQVVVNDDRQAPTSDSDALYPWKRWHVLSDPMGSNEPPVSFFQPSSNAQELLAVYQYMSQLSDEISSIPRYMTGNERIGGAGRTASGLQMLMQNAGKVLQSVAANIDNDIFQPLLRKLYDTVMLTDESGQLQGDDEIRVRGVTFANQKETERARLLEFLQMTSNPMDMQIMGPDGRAEVLREVADRIGLDHLSAVPDKAQNPALQGGPGQPAQPGQLPAPGGGGGAAPGAEAGAPEEGLRAANYGPSGNAV